MQWEEFIGLYKKGPQAFDGYESLFEASGDEQKSWLLSNLVKDGTFEELKNGRLSDIGDMAYRAGLLAGEDPRAVPYYLRAIVTLGKCLDLKIDFDEATSPLPKPPFTRDEGIPSTALFGVYPSTLVTDSELIAALSKISGPPDDVDFLWKHSQYRLGGKTLLSSFLDVTYMARKYRCLYFSKPDGGDDEEILDNGYETGKVYWFKFEPIEWEIVHEEEGRALLLSKQILDGQAAILLEGQGFLQSINLYLSIWRILGYLTIEEYKSMCQVIVDSTPSSTLFIPNPYVHGVDRQDIFLPSYEEATAIFKEGDLASIGAKANDFALAQGVKVGENGYSPWWLRSLDPRLEGAAMYVGEDGRVHAESPDRIVAGIRPLVWLRKD